MGLLPIYKDVDVVILAKSVYVRKVGGRRYNGLHRQLGDVPVATIDDRGNVSQVVNNRGRAYAMRKDVSFQTSQKYKGFMSNQGE